MDDAAAGLAILEETLGHNFAQTDLLIEALTHPSAVRRRGISKRGYERLEFLGDRVLGLIVAELLWRRFPDEAEGEMTRRHTHLVRREALAEVALAVGLGERLIVSKGEDGAGVRDNKSVLADACEAVIAALYLDGGLTPARNFVELRWERRLNALGAPPRDPKTTLQEWVQARGLPLPDYRTVATEGPAHKRRFTVTVKVEGLEHATASASGSSKRAAEIAAAAAALAALGFPA
ncbi:MAG TPA: ribonuclease III [Stellaceae bacterium]|nr:ribonuclease III [Stellaceae bacterium]